MKHDFLKNLSQHELATPIGKLIVPIDTAFSENLTVKDVLESLPGKKIGHQVIYFYSVDQENRLSGNFSTRALLFCEPTSKLRDIVKKHTIQVNKDISLKDTLKLMVNHELMAIPVVDDVGQLLGLYELPKTEFTFDELMTSNKPVRNVFQLIGLTVDLGKLTSSIQEYRYRMPWLLCNVFGGLVCALIASLYQNLLSEIVVLAMFIPLVLTLGESVAMQSMTLSLQFLQYPFIPWKKVFIRLFVEVKTAVLIGVTSSIIVGIVYWFMSTDLLPVIAITLSIFLSSIAVTLFGALLPVILSLLSLDPKVAAGPVVLMLTDIAITALYLSVSHLILLTLFR